MVRVKVRVRVIFWVRVRVRVRVTGQIPGSEASYNCQRMLLREQAAR